MTNLKEQIQQEIKTQLNEADQVMSRRGWLPIVVMIMTLFIAVYFIDNQFRNQVQNHPTYPEATLEELQSKIDELETRIIELEGELK